MKSRSIATFAAFTAGVLALGLTGCSSADMLDAQAGNSTANAGSISADQPAAAVVGAVAVDDAIAGLLPAAIQDAGMLEVGSNLQFPPANFYASDGKTPVGYEVDLATAIAHRLGLTVNYTDSPFENLITSLQSKRVDMTIAGMNDRPDRQEKIDFVDYFKTGIAMLVAEGNPKQIAQPEDLCGLAVTAGVGSSQEEWALGVSKECVASGAQAIEVVTVNNDQQRLNSVKTGRVAAELNDLANLAYIAQTSGGGNDFEVVDHPPLDNALYGMGFNKETVELRDAVAAALQSLIDDGTYGEILSAWGLAVGAVSDVSINGGQ